MNVNETNPSETGISAETLSEIMEIPTETAAETSKEATEGVNPSEETCGCCPETAHRHGIAGLIGLLVETVLRLILRLCGKLPTKKG